MSTIARIPAAIFKTLRPWDWLKNVFVLAPAVIVITSWAQATVVSALLAFAAFCAVASAGYCINDVIDRHRDRLHPIKRWRPVASHALPVWMALLVAALCYAVGAWLGWILGRPVADYLVLFAGLNLIYSIALRTVPIVDVLAVAVGYVLRIDAGAALIGHAPSVWLVICTFLIGLFAALAKRRDDVIATLEEEADPGRPGYNEGFLNVAVSIFLTALVLSYVMYVTDMALAEHARIGQMHLTVPFVIAAALRYLQVILVDEEPGEPFGLLRRDPFMMLMVAGWAGTIGYLVHERSP
ncbi:MAG: UbiA prenyltransferase family protein [Rhodospirillales bacterium]